MLREVAAAGDRERTGVLDVEWDGTHASVFFMFGHPSHVVFDSVDGRRLTGQAALDALVRELPKDFKVAPWRRAMVTEDTVRLSAEELLALLGDERRANGANGAAPEQSEPPTPSADAPAAFATAAPRPWSEDPAGAAPVQPDAPAPPFGLDDFPTLPRGTPLFSDSMERVTNLAAVLPRLPDCVLTVTSADHRAVALVQDGAVADAVSVTRERGLLGDAAATALLTATEGILTAERLDDGRLAASLPTLWHGDRTASGIPAAWLQADEVVADVRTAGRSVTLLFDGDNPGAAVFHEGELVAVYTQTDRWPATTMSALRALLHQQGVSLSVAVPVPAQAPVEPAAGEAPEDVVETPAAPAHDADTTGADVDATATENAGPSTATAESPDTDEAIEPVSAAEPVAPPVFEPLLAETEADETAAEAEGETTATFEAAADLETAPQVEEPTTVEAAAAVDDTPELLEPDDDTADDAIAAEAADDLDDGLLTADADEATDTDDDGPIAAVADDAPTMFAGGIEDDLDDSPAEDPDTAVVVALPETRVATAELPDVEPAVFTIAALHQEAAEAPPETIAAERRAAAEFVPARLDFDVDALRTELTDIALLWLGADDAVPVADAIAATRPGVDDFVATIAAIGAMEIPGHEAAVVRAMAREMHYRASEVLCGV